MATKTWEACAEQRKREPGVWVCVTKPSPETALNPERLSYLKGRAEAVGLATEIRPLMPGKRPQGLFVAWFGEKSNPYARLDFELEELIRRN